MIAAWLLFPLVLLLVSTGCGLLVERIGGWRVPGALLPGLGLAAMIVAATLTTERASTAPATTLVVVGLTALGYATSLERLRALRPPGWQLALALAVFAACAAPVVLSGQATFLGYFTDTDQSFHLELTSYLLAHGRDLAWAPLQSYDSVTALLHEYIGSDYPLGADAALGSLRALVGQDLAWILQPYMAATMVVGALALDALLDGVVESRPLRTLCALTASLCGLEYAFYLQAGIKELAATALITLTVVLVALTLRRPWSARALVPLILVTVAGLDVLSITIVPWVGIPLAAFAVVLLWRHRRAIGARWQPATVGGLAALVLAALALASPALSGIAVFGSVVSGTLGAANVLGNLAAPLSRWQVLGIWPSGDFRYHPVDHTQAVHVLLGLALASAVVATAWLVRRRAWPPLLLLASNLIAAAYLLGRASPYAASKVLMILSPAVVLTAMLGAAALRQNFRRAGIAGWALAAALAAGVLWTDALGYHDSSVAPQARMRDLAAIGDRFSGQSPALYDLWDTLPVYFLRAENVDVPNAFLGSVPLIRGALARPAAQLVAPWDPGVLPLSFVEAQRLLVLPRGPLGSRPPSNFRLAYRDADYDVWARTSSPQVLEHVPFSDGGPVPPRTAPCATVRAAAAQARRAGARLAYVVRPALPTLIPTRSTHTPAWGAQTAAGDPAPYYLHLPQVTGSVRGTVPVPAPGRYNVWVQGSISRRMTFDVGGRRVGTVADQTGQGATPIAVGAITLPPGPASVDVVRPPADLAPGNPITGDLLGPVVLARSDLPPAIEQLPPGRASALCGRSLEWLEVVR
jgi:hypothetical protein